MQFRKGDKVKVVAAGLENVGTVGKTGVVFCDGPDGSGLVAVKGLDGRVKETVLGYRGYAPEQLKRL